MVENWLKDISNHESCIRTFQCFWLDVGAYKHETLCSGFLAAASFFSSAWNLGEYKRESLFPGQAYWQGHFVFQKKHVPEIWGSVYVILDPF